MMKTILIIFLQKHQPLLVDSIDPHSLTTREFLENITDNINTSGEKIKALQALKKFTRIVGQSFFSSITNFEALFSFYIQLDSVVPPEEMSRLNLSNLIIIAPHLISRRCRPVYHEWYRDRNRSGDPPTKLDIFRIIENLEANPELMIEEDTYIPHHITLNIANEHETVLIPEVRVPTYPAYPTTPVATPVSSGSSTSTPPKKTQGHPGNNKHDPKSKNGHFNNSSKPKSRPGSKSPAPSRQPSKSPSRGRPKERSLPTPRSSSGFNTQARINAMAFASSRHPSYPRYESIERPFKKALSPATRFFYDQKVFIQSKNPDRFKDVFISGRCLRCYSKNHKGRDCPMFTAPCPSFCSHCRFLYHDTKMCPYKNDKPRSRSNSRSSSNSRAPSTDRSLQKQE